MYKKQIIVIVCVVAIMGYLLTLPVKGLIKPKDQGSSAGTRVGEPKTLNTSINEAYVSGAAKQFLATGLSAEITKLESALAKAATPAEKQSLQKQLAGKWDEANQPAPAAFYYQAIAEKENNYEDWVNAGDRFNDAYKTTQDTVAQPTFVLDAVSAFQNALKLNAEGLDAKTGLGVAYVNGGAPSPMQGIGLLLEVVRIDPKNRKANLNLGMFAMKSGQYEKAIARFKTMLADKEEIEPYFYLAESYKQLGMKKEAIDAYERCKKLIPDPAFTGRIDQFIKELKN